MKVVVLGATGFLGSYLGFDLGRRGWDVTGVSRTPPIGFTDSHLVGSAGDIEDFLGATSCDLVINAVAIASHEKCEQDPTAAHEINATLPGAWARTAASTGARFVHISTDAVFDGTSSLLYTEADDTRSQSVYGQSKLAGEESVMEANPQALVLRANFFGWSKDSSRGILDFFVNAMTQGEKVSGFSDYEVSSLYMADLSDVLVDAIQAKGQGVYHAVAAKPLSKYDFGLAIAEAGDLDASFIQPGLLSGTSGLAARGHHLGLSVAKMEALLGRPLPSTQQGLARAFSERRAVMDYFGETRDNEEQV